MSPSIRPVVKGSPVRSRRGPATVTGSMRPRQSPLGSHRFPGKAPRSSARKPGDLSPASQHDPRGRGGSQMRITVSIAALAVADRRLPRWRGRRERERRRRSARGRPERPARRPHPVQRHDQHADQLAGANASAPGSGGSGQGVDGSAARTRSASSCEAAKSRNQLNPAAADATLRAAGLRPRGLRHRRTGRHRVRPSGTRRSTTRACRSAARSSRSTAASRCSGTWRRTSRPRQELVLNAPAREPVGSPFPVQVLAYDDDRRRDAGRRRGRSRAAGAPVTTDASGNALVSRQRDGPAPAPGHARRRHPERGDCRSASFDAATGLPGRARAP